MKFIILCDILPAPVSKSGDPTAVIGARIASSAIAGDNAVSDLAGLVGNFKGRSLPDYRTPQFVTYINELNAAATPLFTWLGGTMEFRYAWYFNRETKVAPEIGALPLPRDCELQESSRRNLLHAALRNLIQPGHTSSFNQLTPFLLAGWTGTERNTLSELDDGGRSFRYEAFLASLSALPAPLPHGQLNLARFARLDTFKSPFYLVAAPRFAAKSAPAVFYEPDLEKAVVEQSAGDWIAKVPYRTRFAGFEIEAQCRAIVSPAIPATDNAFLDRPTQWIRRTHVHSGPLPPDTTGVDHQDWLGKLPELVADLLDLPRALVEAVESDRSATASPLAGALINASSRDAAARHLTRTLLMALRDIVGPGCIAGPGSKDVLRGPNGSPAYQTIFGVLESGGVRSPFNSGWGELQNAIASFDAAFRADIAASPSLAEGRRQEWVNTLGRVIAPRLGIAANAFDTTLAAQVSVDSQAAGGFDAAPLRRAVDAAVLPANAVAIQVELWRGAVASHTSRPANFETWLREAAIALNSACARGFRLTECLRRANVDLPWTDAAGIWAKGDPNTLDAELLKDNLRNAVRAYGLGTLLIDRVAASPLEGAYEKTHKRTGELPGSAADQLSEALVAAIKPRLDRLLAPSLAPSDDVGSPDAHSVSFQMERFVSTGGPDIGEDLAGYALLMRRSAPMEDTPGWHSLTSCFAEGDPDGDSLPLTFEDLSRAILCPLPIAQMGAMPTATLTYDNRPIIGDIVPDADLEHPADVEMRLLQLRKPPVQDSPPRELLLPFLAYGAAYEAAPFAISNHGAIPVALQRDDFPAVVDPHKLIGLALPETDGIVRRFYYLRRTGVGALAVAPKLAESQQKGIAYNPWSIPKDTRPLAAEILGKDDCAQVALLLCNGDGSALADCGRVVLDIGAPLTSLEDFDRWLAFDEAIAASADRGKIALIRRKIRSEHRDATSLLNELESKTKSGERGNSTAVNNAIENCKLQDPAVAQLFIRVERKRRAGKRPEVPEQVAQFIAWPTQATPARPRGSLALACEVTTDLKPLFDKVTSTVYAAAGDVVLVELFAAVDNALVAGLPFENGDTSRKRSFDKCVIPQGTAIDPATNVTYALFARYAFALEAATPNLAAVTHDSIEVHVVGEQSRAEDEQEGDIRVDFRRPTSGSDAALAVATDAIGAITIGSQAWRWTGRALSRFPIDAFASSPKAALPAAAADLAQTASNLPLLWDIEGFAERLDETLDDKTVTVAIAPLERGGDYSPLRIDLISPKRRETARYMRFQFASNSRYAAAYRKAGTEIKPRRAIFKNGPWSTDWVRVFRPAQQPKEVPKPGIRALIPLTRSPGLDPDPAKETPSSVSGVLAIVDGAWFEHSGLVDGLMGGVDFAYRKKGFASEFGPDPLVRTFGLSEEGFKSPMDLKDTLRSASLDVVGPIGHTFDTGTASGLYLYSSFFVRPPRFAQADAGAWWMGKLNFRRIVAAEGTAGYWEGAASQTPKPVKSDATRTQAAITLYDVGGAPPGELHVTATGTVTMGRRSVQETIVLALAVAKGTWRLSLSGTSSAFNSYEIASPRFDLRIIARRRTSLFKSGAHAGQPYAWYEALVLARPGNGMWQLVGERRWFDPNDPIEPADAAMTLAVDAPDLSYREARSDNILQVSDATEGLWTQFLPNSETLARTSGIRLDKDVTLTFANDRFQLAAKGRAPFWLATVPKLGGEADQGLFNMILVTMRVASVTGSEEEAYVGLCHAEKMPANMDPVELTWFATAGERAPALPKGSELIGRILTVRARRPQITSRDIDDWKADPWNAFFPTETTDHEAAGDGSSVFGALRPVDAALQIIEIYAPCPIISR